MTDAETILELRAALAAKDQHLQDQAEQLAFLQAVGASASRRMVSCRG
jgi:hypothetical protein